MKKRFFLLLLICFSTTMQCFALRDVPIRLHSFDVFPIDSSFNSKQAILPKSIKGSIYLLNTTPTESNDTIQLNIFNLYSKTKMKLLFFPNQIRNVSVFDFDILGNGDSVLLFDVSRVVLFVKKNKDEYRFVKKIVLKYGLTSVRYWEGKYYLLNDILDTQCPLESPLYIQILNLKTFQIEDLKILKKPEGYFFLFITQRNILDFSKGTILYSDVTNSNIYVQNILTDTIITLKRNIPNWKLLDTVINFSVKNIQSQMPQIESLNKNVTEYKRVCFLNDTTILALWMNNSKTEKWKYYMDTWMYRRNEWTLVDSAKLVYSYQKETGNYTLNKLIIDPQAFVLDNQILEFRAISPEIDINNIWSTYLEFEKQNEKYFIDNGIRYSLIVRKVY